MNIAAVIPARLKSKRFPNKLLYPFLGKPIIGHVINNVLKLKFVNKIIVATEDKEIKDYVKENYPTVEVAMIFNCRCGTERTFQYYIKNQKFDYYLSFPSDEPCIDVQEINNLWKQLSRNHKDEIVTFYSKFFCFEDLKSVLSCKIITSANDYMIYNSRSIIPVDKSGNCISLDKYKKHVGIFIFSKELLMKKGRELWGSWLSFSADITGLEQNRFIDYGIKVKMYKIKHIGFGIDSPKQVKILETRIKSGGKQSGYSSSSLQQLSEDYN